MVETDLTGMLAVSRAGNDKGRIYYILKEEPPYLWLADGKHRKVAAPKKKKRKHVQLIKYFSEAAGICDLQNKGEFSDADIRRVIRQYIQNRQE